LKVDIEAIIRKSFSDAADDKISTDIVSHGPSAVAVVFVVFCYNPFLIDVVSPETSRRCCGSCKAWSGLNLMVFQQLERCTWDQTLKPLITFAC